jgi:hypothetical protein
MRKVKYLVSILLIIWGILIGWIKLYSVGFHIPILTIITTIAIISGISKSKYSNITFFISAILWVIVSAENIGFVIFFDNGNYERMIFGSIPLILSTTILLTTSIEFKYINSFSKKIFLLVGLVLLGIGSYIYKPTIKEINCWYYFDKNQDFKISFADSPNSKFEVELNSDQLKKLVKKEGMQYSSREGYYCPETKVRVITSFGKIISAKIKSFRNTDIDKKVVFEEPTEIPIYKINGNREILKPFMINLWN